MTTPTLKPCPAGHAFARVTPFICGLMSVMCDECGWRATGKDDADAIARWNHRPTEEALEKRAETAERQVAAVREALEMCASLFDELSTVAWYPESDVNAHTLQRAEEVVTAALKADAGKDFVPRSELDAERRKVEKLVSLLTAYCWHGEDDDYCAGCNSRDYPNHRPGCAIAAALAETKEGA